MSSRLYKQIKKEGMIAFESIVDTYSDKIYTYCYLLTEDSWVAEDITEQVFLNYLKYAKRFESGDMSPAVSLFSLADGLYEEQKKKSTRDIATTAYTMKNAAKRSDMQIALASVISELPANYKKVYILREICGLKKADVCEIVGMSDDQFTIFISKVREKVKDALMKLGNFKKKDAAAGPENNDSEKGQDISEPQPEKEDGADA